MNSAPGRYPRRHRWCTSRGVNYCLCSRSAQVRQNSFRDYLRRSLFDLWVRGHRQVAQLSISPMFAKRRRIARRDSVPASSLWFRLWPGRPRGHRVAATVWDPPRNRRLGGRVPRDSRHSALVDVEQDFGRAARSRSGKSSVASRRITSPKAESAFATASIVSALSHSANSSEMLGGSSSGRDDSPSAGMGSRAAASVWLVSSVSSGFWL